MEMRREPGPRRSLGRLWLIQLAVLLVCTGGEEVQAKGAASSSAAHQHYEDLGEYTDPTTGAENGPPQNKPHTPGMQDRRVVDPVNQKTKEDPRRSQLHPDCQPFLENTQAQIAQGVSCKDLCETKQCVSYQEFHLGDTTYKKGECKLYMCPPRFQGSDTRRSEDEPDCNPFSQNNSEKLKGHSCSGMCAVAKGCKAYREWKPGSEAYPKGECRLYKCPPKYSIVARAEAEADRIRKEANLNAQAIVKAAEEKRRVTEAAAAETLRKAKAEADKLVREATTHKNEEAAKATALTEQSVANAKQLKTTTRTETTALKEATKIETTKAQAEADRNAKAAEDALAAAVQKAKTMVATAETQIAKQTHASAVATQTAQDKAVETKRTAAEDADHTTAVAGANSKELMQKADETTSKATIKATQQEKANKASKQETANHNANLKAAAVAEATAIKQKAQDAAVQTQEFAKGNSSAIRAAAETQANQIRVEMANNELESKRKISVENGNKESSNKAHEKQLQQKSSTEQGQKSQMLQQLLAKQKQAKDLLASETKKAEARVAADELKNKQEHTDLLSQSKTIETQAKKDAISIGTKANMKKSEVEALAAKTEADAKAAATAESLEKTRLNAVRIKKLNDEAKANANDARKTEDELRHEKDQLMEAQKSTDENAQKKASEIAGESGTLEQRLRSSMDAAKAVQDKTQAAIDRSMIEAATNAMTNCQASAAEVSTAQVTKKIACDGDKEIAQKATTKRENKITATQSFKMAAKDTNDALSLCNDKVAEGKENAQKAKALLGGLSVRAAALGKASSDEKYAKAQAKEAQGIECATQAAVKQQQAQVALENAQNIAGEAAKAEEKKLLNAGVTCDAHTQLVAVVKATDERCAKAADAAKKAEANEKAQKEQVLKLLSLEREHKAKSAEIFAAKFMKENEKAQAAAEAAKQKAAIDAVNAANGARQNTDKACNKAKTACTNKENAAIISAQKPNDLEKKKALTDAKVDCEQQTDQCTKMSTKENAQKDNAAKATDELEIKTTTSKELATKAATQAERARAAEKSHTLTMEVAETKVKAGAAVEMRKTLQAATVAPAKALVEAQKAVTASEKVDEVEIAKVEAAKNVMRTAQNILEVAKAAVEAAKEKAKKSQMNFETECAPYKQAEKTLEVSSELVEKAAAKVNGVTATAGNALMSDLNMLELIDLEAQPTDSPKASNATVVSDEQKRQEGRTKRREARIREHAEKSASQKALATKQQVLSEERATKATERQTDATTQATASAELHAKAITKQGQMEGANQTTVASLTTMTSLLTAKANVATDKAREFTKTATELRGKSTEREAESKELKVKSSENQGKSQSNEALLKAGEARSSAESKELKDNFKDEQKEEAKREANAAGEAASEAEKEKSAADALAAANVEQERLAKELVEVEAKLEKVNENSQKAEQVREKAVGAAQVARAVQKNAANAHEAAVSSTSLTKEASTKAAEALTVLQTRVDSLMAQTTKVETNVKLFAQHDIDAQRIADQKRETLTVAQEIATNKVAQAASADEAASKAGEAKELAAAKLRKAGTEKERAGAASVTATSLAKSAAAAAASAQAEKKKLADRMPALEQQQGADKSALDAAKSKVATANTAAAVAGNTAVLNLRTEMTGAKAQEINQDAQTAFGEAVASTLGVQTSEVSVSKVTGNSTLTVHTSIIQSDMTGASAMKATMLEVDPVELLASFKTKATALSKELPMTLQITGSSGTVSAHLTDDQKTSRLAEETATATLENVTSKVTALTEASSLASIKASDTNAASESAERKRVEANTALQTANTDVTTAQQEASLTATREEKALKMKQDQDQRSDEAIASKAKLAAVTQTAESQQQSLQQKLTNFEKKQDQLGVQLDSAAEERASASVAADHKGTVAKAAASELFRLQNEKEKADLEASALGATEDAEVKLADSYLSQRSTLQTKLATLAAQITAAKAAIVQATAAHKHAKEELVKEGATKHAEKKSALAASLSKADQIAKAAGSKTVYKVEVSNKMEGITSSEFTDDLKKAYIAALAVTLGVDAEDCVINSVDDTSELGEDVRRLGETVGEGSIDVQYSVVTTSQAAGDAAKKAVDSMDPAAMTETFKAEAATVGAAIPPTVKVDKPVAGEIKQEKTNTHAAELQAAIEVLSAEKARMELADVGVKKFKDRCDSGKAMLKVDVEDFKIKEQAGLDAEGPSKLTRTAFEQAGNAQRKTGDVLTIDRGRVKAATSSAELAENNFKKADIAAQQAAGVAAASWAEFLKGDANLKSADALGKSPTKLDVWNIAMAKTADEKGVCQGTAQKFQLIIMGAQNATLAHAKEQCLEGGNKWNDYEAKVQKEVATQTAGIIAKHTEETLKNKSEKRELEKEVAELKAKQNQMKTSRERRADESVLDSVEELLDVD